jgi:hypothetical protein
MGKNVKTVRQINAKTCKHDESIGSKNMNKLSASKAISITRNGIMHVDMMKKRMCRPI